MKQKIKAHPRGKNKDKQLNPGLDKTAGQLPSVIKVTMLPTKSLRPSGWNPNIMSAEEELQLIQEVKRLGHPPKPIVVRAKGKNYEIVDGEHSLEAALECKLKEVPCEVIQADNLEAMRQSLTRNRHGKNDPVKLGRLFQRMNAHQSLRELGNSIGLSEGTIRNSMIFAEAAEMRNRYALKHADEGATINADAEIAKLSVKQARKYVQLPEGKRDEWLDAGAQLDAAKQPSAPLASANQDVRSACEAVRIHDPADAELDENQCPEEHAPPAENAEESIATFTTVSTDQPFVDQ